jgi:hypothetical protein
VFPTCICCFAAVNSPLLECGQLLQPSTLIDIVALPFIQPQQLSGCSSCLAANALLAKMSDSLGLSVLPSVSRPCAVHPAAAAALQPGVCGGPSNSATHKTYAKITDTICLFVAAVWAQVMCSSSSRSSRHAARRVWWPTYTLQIPKQTPRSLTTIFCSGPGPDNNLLSWSRSNGIAAAADSICA